MNELLFLLLGKSPDSPVQWAFFKESSLVDAGVCTSANGLSDIANRAAAVKKIVAILPGEQAAMRVIEAPPTKTAKFRAAAAYLLGDELAEDLDKLHISVSNVLGVGVALAVKKSIMNEWIEALGEAGVSPDVVTPDFALLPVSSTSAVLIYEPHRIVGANLKAGFAAERPLADALAAKLVEDDHVNEVTAYGDPARDKIELCAKSIDWRALPESASMFGLYARGFLSSPPVNFLCGEFRKRRDWRRQIDRWRKPALLAAACFVAFMSAVLADSVRQARIAGVYGERMTETHVKAFPDAAAADPVAHAQMFLSSQGGDSDFLSLSSRFAEGLGEKNAIQINRIRYNADRGEFTVNVSFSDINELDAFKQRLIKNGVDAREAGGVRRSGDYYIGELRVGS